MKEDDLEHFYTPAQAAYLFGTIMAVIICTDSLKVYLAKAIRHHLTPQHLLWIRRISGLLLCAIAVGLVIKML